MRRDHARWLLHNVCVDRRARNLRRDIEFTSGERAAKTLAKTDGLRVTLVLLKRGASLHPEAAASPQDTAQGKRGQRSETVAF